MLIIYGFTKSTTKATAKASGTTSRQLLRGKRLPFLHLSLHQRHAEHNRALVSAAAPTTRHTKPYVTLEPSMPLDLSAGDGALHSAELRAPHAASSASRVLREQRSPRATRSASGVLGELRDPQAAFSASRVSLRAACSADSVLCEQRALRTACSASSVFSEQHDPRVSRPLLPLAAPSATETVTHDAGAGANRRTVPPLRPAESADQRNARSDTAPTGGDEVWPRRAETNADATRTASDRVKASFGISKEWEIIRCQYFVIFSLVHFPTSQIIQNTKF